MAKLVYAWGQRRRLLKLNDLALYRFKIAKEDRRELPAEYRLEDFDKILRQFDPSQWGQWRPWALLTLLGTQGIRNNSARHLQWADVDLEDGTLAWRARWDKLGREWRQPLRSEARAALMVCLAWREKAKYYGPWVFFYRTNGGRSTTTSLFMDTRRSPTRSKRRRRRQGCHIWCSGRCMACDGWWWARSSS